MGKLWYLCCRVGKHSKLPPSTEGRFRRKHCSVSDGMITPAVKFDIFMTISHLLVSRPTLEFTKFKQQVCSTTQMHYNWEQAAVKKLNMARQLWTPHIKQKCSAGYLPFLGEQLVPIFLENKQTPSPIPFVKWEKFSSY